MIRRQKDSFVSRTHDRYDAITIALHWATALLVVTLFVLAEVWGFFSRDTRHTLEALHISLGVLLSAIIVIRIIWRTGSGRRLPPVVSQIPYWAARCAHYLLYALLIGQVAFGYFFRWAQGEAFTFFGLFAIPAPFGPDKSLANVVGEAHELFGWSIIVVAGLHAAAALFHHYSLRDGTLIRMLPR